MSVIDCEPSPLDPNVFDARHEETEQGLSLMRRLELQRKKGIQDHPDIINAFNNGRDFDPVDFGLEARACLTASMEAWAQAARCVAAAESQMPRPEFWAWVDQYAKVGRTGVYMMLGYARLMVGQGHRTDLLFAVAKEKALAALAYVATQAEEDIGTFLEGGSVAGLQLSEVAGMTTKQVIKRVRELREATGSQQRTIERQKKEIHDREAQIGSLTLARQGDEAAQLKELRKIEDDLLRQVGHLHLLMHAVGWQDRGSELRARFRGLAEELRVAVDDLQSYSGVLTGTWISQQLASEHRPERYVVPSGDAATFHNLLLDSGKGLGESFWFNAQDYDLPWGGERFQRAITQLVAEGALRPDEDQPPGCAYVVTSDKPTRVQVLGALATVDDASPFIEHPPLPVAVPATDPCPFVQPPAEPLPERLSEQLARGPIELNVKLPPVDAPPVPTHKGRALVDPRGRPNLSGLSFDLKDTLWRMIWWEKGQVFDRAWFEDSCQEGRAEGVIADLVHLGYLEPGSSPDAWATTFALPEPADELERKATADVAIARDQARVQRWEDENRAARRLPASRPPRRDGDAPVIDLGARRPQGSQDGQEG